MTRPRLYDLLINRDDSVYVQRSKDGQLHLSDRYLIWDMDYLRRIEAKAMPDRTGIFIPTASKPYERTGDLEDGDMLRSKVPTSLDGYGRVRWSRWSAYNDRDQTTARYRLGSLEGEPVAANDAWLGRLPEDLQLQTWARGTSSMFVLATGQSEVVGGFMPMRISDPTSIHKAIAESV